MEYLENPFTPSFGEVPAHLAGRQQIIRDLDRAFLSQRRRPELTSIFSGARGTGKTALMSRSRQGRNPTLDSRKDDRALGNA